MHEGCSSCVAQAYMQPSRHGCGVSGSHSRTSRGYIKEGVWYPHSRTSDSAPKEPYPSTHCDRLRPASSIGNPPGLATPNKYPLQPQDNTPSQDSHSPPGLKNPSEYQSSGRQNWQCSRHNLEADNRHYSWRSNKSSSRSPSPTHDPCWRSSPLFSKPAEDSHDSRGATYKSLKVHVDKEAKPKSQSCPSSRCASPKDQLAFSAPATPVTRHPPTSTCDGRASACSLPDLPRSPFTRQDSDCDSARSGQRSSHKPQGTQRTNSTLDGAAAALAAAQKALGVARKAVTNQARDACIIPESGKATAFATAVLPSVVKAALSSNLLKKQWAPNPPTEFDDKVSEAKKLISKALCSQLVKESTYDRWANTGPGYDSSLYWDILRDEDGNWKELTLELLLQIPQPPPPARCRPVVKPVANPVELAHMVHNTVHHKALYDQLPPALSANSRSKSVEGFASMTGDFDGCEAGVRPSSNPVTRQSSATSTPRTPITIESSDTSTPAPELATSPAPTSIPESDIACTPESNTTLFAHAIIVTPSTTMSLPASDTSLGCAPTPTPIENPAASLCWTEQPSCPDFTPAPVTPAIAAGHSIECDLSDTSSPMSEASTPASVSSIPGSIDSSCSTSSNINTDPLVKYYENKFELDSQTALEQAVQQGLSTACCTVVEEEDEDEDDFLTFSCPSIIMTKLMGANRLVSV